MQLFLTDRATRFALKRYPLRYSCPFLTSSRFSLVLHARIIPFSFLTLKEDPPLLFLSPEPENRLDDLTYRDKSLFD